MKRGRKKNSLFIKFTTTKPCRKSSQVKSSMKFSKPHKIVNLLLFSARQSCSSLRSHQLRQDLYYSGNRRWTWTFAGSFRKNFWEVSRRISLVDCYRVLQRWNILSERQGQTVFKRSAWTIWILRFQAWSRYKRDSPINSQKFSHE